ncbi:unnamed protein product [Symbiodinium natans]|uniref:Uncharacterized protein n=1 Tax=Symbiodinium natans TaxID=878477 RepID=A0A812RG80_9DINO|nr:unnamed protein product [Symbiodinium natans]
MAEGAERQPLKAGTLTVDMSPMSPDQESSETLLQATVRHYEEAGLWRILRQYTTTSEQMLKLDFVITALHDHASSIRGDKVKVEVALRWFRVAREMLHVDGLPFNVVHALGSHLGKIEKMNPLPEEDVIKNLLQAVDNLQQSTVPGTGDSVRTLCEGLLENAPEEAAKKFEAHKAAVESLCMSGFASLTTEYGKYPACKWFIAVLQRAAFRGRYSFKCLRQAWLSGVDMLDSMGPLAWVMLVKKLDTLIVEESLTVADCQAASFPAAEHLREALLTFFWDATRLRSVMQDHVRRAEATHAQVTTGIITIGVPLLQVVFQALAQRFGLDGISSALVGESDE